jgi:hypothetical protein
MDKGANRASVGKVDMGKEGQELEVLFLRHCQANVSFGKRDKSSLCAYRQEMVLVWCQYGVQVLGPQPYPLIGSLGNDEQCNCVARLVK